MIITLAVIAAIALVFIVYMRLPKFGKAPSGSRLQHIKQSPNYRGGQFQNVNITPSLTEGNTIAGVMFEFIFSKKPNRRPVDLIPSVKTDLKNIPPTEDLLVWFGHSSYFLQVDGRTFLVDPVFSGNASPIPGSNKAFPGSDIYTVDDLPRIDYLLITHDHYDHVDYDTIIRLKNKTGIVICGLGVAEHFERWGYDMNIVIEKDRNETVDLEPGFTIHTAPARHFSGRGFKRNISLWLSFILKTPTMNLFLGGDSGYDTHFKEIGEKYGPFDLAILENGQYNPKWKYIHMMPEEAVQAAIDAKAKRMFPVHSGKFAMAYHPWNEPLQRVSAAAGKLNVHLITPMIGEKVELKNTAQPFTQWWANIK